MVYQKFQEHKYIEIEQQQKAVANDSPPQYATSLKPPVLALIAPEIWGTD